MGKLRPILDSLAEAALKGARHADAKLPQLARNHGDQLDDWGRRIRDQDRDLAARSDVVTTTRGRNTKHTVYDTDSNRPVYEDGTILEDFGGGRRGDNATEIGRLGNPGDDGGHLGAHRFFGDTPDQGIAPQIANLNRGAWKRMENHWAALVQSGMQVDYSIDVYPPGAVRPDHFDVHYIVSDPRTGDIISEHSPSFPNAHGATFNP